MLRSVLVVLVFGAFSSNPLLAQAPFPTGTWQINGNGAEGHLVIKSIDGLGNVSGTIYGEKIIAGVYDAKTKCLSFLRVYQLPSPGHQAWTGYVFDGADSNHTISGTFQSFGFGRDVKRVNSGWYGKMPRPKK